ncbi:hypothetical protein [Archaeoglobus sulfaticallidus]|uniref:hypothetical protein n=1 Tax=Archaeoglobus sulfaticallidus TaxID=1316941 RepID=UPI00064E990D|nr:hypothetical protein [Archaeoglobus sulfaticallidus]
MFLLDIGTTSIKCAVMDLEAILLWSSKSTKAKIDYLGDRAEQDPSSLWGTVIELGKSVVEESKAEVSAICLAHTWLCLMYGAR